MKRLNALSMLYSLLVGVFVWNWAMPVHAQSAAEYRSAYTDLIELIELSSELSGRTELLDSAAHVQSQLQSLSDDELLALNAGDDSLVELQQLINTYHDEIIHLLQTPLPPAVNTRAADDGGIDIPNVNVEPGFCDYATGAIAFSELAVSKLAGAALAAKEFTCLESVDGVNGALLCVVLSFAKNTADLLYENAKFCRDQQRAAKGETSLELTQNIGRYLNIFVDDVTTSSRATQDSVDDLQTDVDTSMTSISSIQDELDTGFTTIDANLDTSLSDLDTLLADMTDLASIAADIQLRVQENQIDIEDVQTTTADLQESTEEIRTDTQSIISSVASIQDDLDSVSSDLNSGYGQVNQDTIAAALTRPGFVVPEYALPAAAGGQLETAREIVIQAVLALQNLNLGDTGTALSLVALGDVAYNNSEYLTAYELFAQAYQSLVDFGNGK